MARYIDADKLKQNLTELYDLSKWDHRGLHFSLLDMVGNIDGEPTADVVPVILAHWIDTLYGWKCSNCKEEQEYTLYLKHCPNCGAKMDEEVE